MEAAGVGGRESPAVFEVDHSGRLCTCSCYTCTCTYMHMYTTEPRTVVSAATSGRLGFLQQHVRAVPAQQLQGGLLAQHTVALAEHIQQHFPQSVADAQNADQRCGLGSLASGDAQLLSRRPFLAQSPAWVLANQAVHAVGNRRASHGEQAALGTTGRRVCPFFYRHPTPHLRASQDTARRPVTHPCTVRPCHSAPCGGMAGPGGESGHGLHAAPS